MTNRAGMTSFNHTPTVNTLALRTNVQQCDTTRLPARRLGHNTSVACKLAAVFCLGMGLPVPLSPSRASAAPPTADREADSGARAVCIPGQQVSCACPGGASGVQVCNDDASGLGQCGCEDAKPVRQGHDNASDGKSDPTIHLAVAGADGATVTVIPSDGRPTSCRSPCALAATAGSARISVSTGSREFERRVHIFPASKSLDVEARGSFAPAIVLTVLGSVGLATGISMLALDSLSQTSDTALVVGGGVSTSLGGASLLGGIIGFATTGRDRALVSSVPAAFQWTAGHAG